MKAVLIGKNKELVWSDVADPVIGGDQVLVKVSAAALNRADILQREGNYPPPEGWPEWMGLEVAGESVAMTEQAQNAMLKTIEEPPQYAIILLLTNNIERLLPTILSLVWSCGIRKFVWDF